MSLYIDASFFFQWQGLFCGSFCESFKYTCHQDVWEGTENNISFFYTWSYWYWNKLLKILPFFLQLGYVVYRRVLRYYSGEEDGLGELLIMILRKSTLLTLYPNFLPKPSLVFFFFFFFLCFLFRYEEGFIKGRGQEVCYSSQTANYSRWTGIWLGLNSSIRRYILLLGLLS